MLGTFHSVPLFLLPWVTCQTVITEKLKKHVLNVKMQILSSNWDKTNWWERQVLQLPSSGQVFRREIIMTASTIPCWYARTIIPQETYRTDNCFFDRLEHTSMATLIYNEPRVKRTFLQSYSATPHLIEYHWAAPWCEEGSILSIRFANFKLDNQFPFYLIELFLPGLERVLSSCT